jgi:cobyrinic acid a,c-diamide synthase
LKPATDIPRIVIAGASSNVGKTTVTAGLIAALRRRGLVAQPFKCGPDYIDPSYHERASGRPCRNLDTWMLTDSQLLETFSRACQGVDIAVVEGVMGLYDGSDWHDERGSTAQIAKLLQAPVVLVTDISGSARSAAAEVLGFKTFDAAVGLTAVVLNFAGSERHARGCADAIVRATALPMVGWLPRDLRLRIPERHLGLVPGGEQVDGSALVEQIAAAMEQRFDVDAVVALARGAVVADAHVGREGAAGHVSEAARVNRVLGAERPVIAVARDEAFCFYYPENIELLIEEGARIEFFSPLRGERPPANAAGVYLGGGYPELHGPALEANKALWDVLRELHGRDAPIYAECGGFMVLTEALFDSEGHRWAMAGLLPGVARMSGRLAALGYRHATAVRDNLLAKAGETLRGHEFRYSTWAADGRAAGGVAVGSEPAPAFVSHVAWDVRGTRHEAPPDAVGYARGNLLASYLHVHFGQQRALAARFVAKAIAPKG